MAKKECVALYLRVSTEHQNTAMQKQALLEYCKQKGWKIARIYEDVASGGKADRQSLSQLMQDVKAGKYDVVGVWKFDRFARSTQALLQALEAFRALDVHFFSLQEQIDTSTPAGKVLYTLIAAFAEFERETIRERVKAGMEAAKAKGKRIGRPRVGLDYQRMLQMHEDGCSIRQIATALGVGRSTVHTYLQSA